jgi:hypothetical protein
MSGGQHVGRLSPHDNHARSSTRSRSPQLAGRIAVHPIVRTASRFLYRRRADAVTHAAIVSADERRKCQGPRTVGPEPRPRIAEANRRGVIDVSPPPRAARSGREGRAPRGEDDASPRARPSRISRTQSALRTTGLSAQSPQTKAKGGGGRRSRGDCAPKLAGRPALFAQTAGKGRRPPDAACRCCVSSTHLICTAGGDQVGG